MKILVSGAAGFIGASLIEKLVRDGNEVVLLDYYSDYYSINLKKQRVEHLINPMGLNVHCIDIAQRLILEDFMAEHKPEAVIHLAAQAGVRLGLESVEKYVDSNLLGFTNILTSSLRNNVQEFIYASSSSVYGDSINLPYRESDLTIRPKSFYGATKLANELLSQTLTAGYKMKVRGLRFFTVYGEWGRPDMAYFRLLNSAINKREFELFGDGSIVRDFTHVDDVTMLITMLLKELQTREDGFSDVVNIGGGNPRTMNEMIRIIEEIMCTKINIKKHDVYPGDVLNTNAAADYLNSLVGISPQVSLENGLKKFCDWGTSEGIIDSLSNWIDSE